MTMHMERHRAATRSGLATVVVAGLIFAFAGTAAAQSPPASIAVELVTLRGLPVGGERKWIEMFGRAGVRDVRVRRGRGGERAAIESSRVGGRTRYRIVGIVTRTDEVALPGQVFRSRQVKELKAWLDRIRTRGPKAAGGQPEAFGLTSGELAELFEAVEEPLSGATKGTSLSEVIRAARQRSGLSIDVASSAERLLHEADPCLDELSGISVGTALAAALRPAGLAVVPKVLGPGKYRLVILPARGIKERWPVGWPLIQTPGETARRFMKLATVEIIDQPLPVVLHALERPTGVRFLVDHNGLALRGEEPAAVKINIPERRSTYKSVLDRGLRDAGLRGELRIDEAGRPIYWIFPVKHRVPRRTKR